MEFQYEYGQTVPDKWIVFLWIQTPAANRTKLPNGLHLSCLVLPCLVLSCVMLCSACTHHDPMRNSGAYLFHLCVICVLYTFLITVDDFRNCLLLYCRYFQSYKRQVNILYRSQNLNIENPILGHINDMVKLLSKGFDIILKRNLREPFHDLL